MLVEFEDLGGYGTCDPCTIGRQVEQHNPIKLTLTLTLSKDIENILYPFLTSFLALVKREM